jgi:hypothetical protein
MTTSVEAKVRDGHLAAEREAIGRTEAEIASYSASFLVQVLSHPESVLQWARRHDVAEHQVYNMLAGPQRGEGYARYGRVRRMLAADLDFEVSDINDVVDAWPAPARGDLSEDDQKARRVAPAPLRSGSSRVERRVIHVLRNRIDTFEASMVVQILLHPASIADWTRSAGENPSQVYNMLAGPERGAQYRPYHRTRERLATSLGISKEALDELIDRPRARPLETLLAG